MHYNVFIILNRAPPDLHSHVKTALTPFYIENDARIRPRWDWFKIGDGPFSDSNATSWFHDIGESEKTCLCSVGKLPDDYSAAALLTPEGQWHDIEDFGWRLIDGDSENNKRAAEAWFRHFKEAVAQYPESIGVEVHCHG